MGRRREGCDCIGGDCSGCDPLGFNEVQSASLAGVHVSCVGTSDVAHFLHSRSSMHAWQHIFSHSENGGEESRSVETAVLMLAFPYKNADGICRRLARNSRKGIIVSC